MARGLPLRLTPDEARYVTRGASVVAFSVLSVGAFWLSPWSPEAVDRPALLWGWGFPNLAFEAWVQLAHGYAAPDTRAEALWRAANLAAIDLQLPQSAVELLRELIRTYPDHPRAPEARERLAALYAGVLRDPTRAAETWEAAADEDPKAAAAGDWYLEAGISYARANNPERSEAALRAATAYPEVAVDAWLALGSALLAEEPDEAHEAFRHALGAGASGDEASLAHLGSATALEREDRLEEALAELERARDDGDADASIEQRIRLLKERTGP